MGNEPNFGLTQTSDTLALRSCSETKNASTAMSAVPFCSVNDLDSYYYGIVSETNYTQRAQKPRKHKQPILLHFYGAAETDPYNIV